MTFFHASQTKNIKILKPNISNHNIPLIYFSDKRENVLRASGINGDRMDLIKMVGCAWKNIIQMH